MRHSLKYGLLHAVDMSDDKIKSSIPKDAAAELEKASGRNKHPASFLVKQIIDAMPAGNEFTVSDVYILLHKDQEGIIVKMPTLRSTLSTLSRKKDAMFAAANKDLKHRIYVKL